MAQDYGLFQTWQFSMYKNVMQRLVVSKYRTRDPAKASAFVIPFDAGVHSYIDHKNGKYRLGSPYGWSVINWLQESKKSVDLWKYRGHDHYVFFGLTEFTMTGIAQKEFFKGTVYIIYYILYTIYYILYTIYYILGQAAEDGDDAASASREIQTSGRVLCYILTMP